LALNDLEHLPKVVTNINGINDVLLAIDPEIVQLRTDISNLIKELYVKTTENLIARWEKDFSLKYDASLTLAQRRQRILNKLARKRPLTWANLRALIKSNIGETTQFYISNDAANYFFRIYVATENISGLQDAIKQAKPAYLTFEIVVSEFFRKYCGTFYCNMNPI
jgi:hypothetical protein